MRGHVILLEASDGSTTQLAKRMLPFGIEPVLLRDFSEAQQFLREQRIEITGVLIPTDISVDNLKKDVKALRRVGPASGLIFASAGKAPGHSDRKKLRAAGLTIALWEPYDDGTLRFQLNRAMGGDDAASQRSTPRVPTYLMARIFSGDREKEAIIYSLSEGGCFLETPRANLEGALVDVELRLPASDLHIRCEVVYSNVPGNLQRPNLPMGMGTRFVDLDPTSSKLIAAFVAQRLEYINV